MPKSKTKTTKKKTTKKTKLEKQITKIAKKVALKTAETISPISNFEFTMDYNKIAVRNLIYFISQGDKSYQIHGEKMFIKNIRLRVRLFWNGNISVGITQGNSPRIVRLVVFKTKTPLTVSTNTDVTKSELFRQESGSSSTLLATTGHIDLRKVDLFYDKLVSFDARDMAQTSSVVGKLKEVDINIPLNKVEYFDNDESIGYLKGGNYYLGAIYDDTIGGSIGGITLSCQFAVNVKDM